MMKDPKLERLNPEPLLLWELLPLPFPLLPEPPVTFTDREMEAWVPALSRTFRLTGYSPVELTEHCQVDVLPATQLGGIGFHVKVYGKIPPETAALTENWDPFVTGFGLMERLLIARGALTVSGWLLEAWVPLWSTTLTPSVNNPVWLGEHCQFETFPGVHGGGVLLQLYEYGGAPPETVTFAVKDEPCVTELGITVKLVT